eukprot:281470_1
MSSVVQQIDRGLKRYYEHQGAPYLNPQGVGKFQEWVEDNGFDSDNIIQEFEQNPKDVSFTEFDANFPINSASATANEDKIETIFKVVFACYKEPAAFFNSPNLPDEDTQMEMAVQQSLLEIEKNVPSHTTNDYVKPQPKHCTQTHHDDHDEPHISFIEPTPKYPDASGGHTHKMYRDERDEFCGYSDEDDEYITNIDARTHNKRKPQKRDNYSPLSKRNVAKDAVYESQWTTPNLEVSSVRDNMLRLQYKDAIELRKKAHDALCNGQYKIALKYYSQMFMHVGCNGMRRLRDFCTEDGELNPLKKRNPHHDTNDNVYTAMDKLRNLANIQMAFIYTQHQKWNKVIEKCSQVLESDEDNIKALLYRGRAYRHQKQFDQANIDLTKAKKSEIVDMEIESELNALKRNKDGRPSDEDSGGILSLRGGITFTSFTNNNWPVLPLRDIQFEGWLRHDSSDVPCEMLYPVPLQKNRYKLYQNEEMLDMSVVWLDVDVAEKLIKLNVFDVNKQKKGHAFQSYLHQLCAGKLSSGYTYESNKEKFIRLVTVLCGDPDIAIELRDDEQRTALAFAVRNSCIDLGIVLLRYGANVNDGSVRKEIERKSKNVQDWLRKGLGVLR